MDYVHTYEVSVKSYSMPLEHCTPSNHAVCSIPLATSYLKLVSTKSKHACTVKLRYMF